MSIGHGLFGSIVIIFKLPELKCSFQNLPPMRLRSQFILGWSCSASSGPDTACPVFITCDLCAGRGECRGQDQGSGRDASEVQVHGGLAGHQVGSLAIGFSSIDYRRDKAAYSVSVRQYRYYLYRFFSMIIRWGPVYEKDIILGSLLGVICYFNHFLSITGRHVFVKST